MKNHSGTKRINFPLLLLAVLLILAGCSAPGTDQTGTYVNTNIDESEHHDIPVDPSSETDRTEESSPDGTADQSNTETSKADSEVITTEHESTNAQPEGTTENDSTSSSVPESDTSSITDHETTSETHSVTELQTDPDTQTMTETVNAPETETQPDHQDEKDYSSVIAGKNQFVIIYEPNGGSLGSVFNNKTSIKDSATGKICCTKKDDFFYQTVTDSYYLCPHSMGDKNYLKRSGYVLYGYNTKADGSGIYYGCGWNIPVALGEKIVLYAMWAKESDHSLFTFSNGTIKKYSGNEKVVVIPSSIDSINVTSVSSNAFSGKSMTTVIMPSCLTTLESESFNDCAKLQTVYQFDKISEMPNDTFNKCPNFSTLIINNAQNVKYTGTNKVGTYMMKFQRLLLNKDKPKIILISGSNAVYGVLTPIIEKALNNKYTVINYGTNYYVPSTIYIDIFSKFAQKGDKVVILPEEVPQQWGDNQSTSGYAQFFPAIEGCMEVISYLDIRNYSNMFSYIAKYNNTRADGTCSYESVFSEAVDQNGDFSYSRTTPVTKKWSNSNLYDWFGETTRSTLFTPYNVSNLNRSFDLCIEAGAEIYISYSVVDKSFVTDYSDQTLSAYENAARMNFVNEKKGRYIISSLSDYVWEHELFYNSMHHLLTDASRKRSEMLAADIKAQLNKEN
ncbi:MAG: leucine-rich repeat protein [Clostridia bacterium]|nr:leucine-rich repeat protein [Clostridia bacterium]